MKTLKLTGIAFALSAAAAFTMTPAFAADTTDATMINCKGVNACKGQGSCKTATNACKGQNACKGTGMMKMTEDDCTKAGGTVDKSNTDTTED